MNTKDLIAHTINDLSTRLATGSEYDILMTTALLRKLLCNKDALLRQINVKENQSIFKVNIIPPLHIRHPNLFKELDRLSSYIWFAGGAFDPENSHFQNGVANIQIVSLSDFLNIPVVYVQLKSMTVDDLIKYFANKEGGIHKQNTQINLMSKDYILAQLNELVGPNNRPLTLETIKAIATVVIRDVKKLVV